MYVLCAAISKQLQLELSLRTLMQALSLTLFARNRLNQQLGDTDYTSQKDDFHI